MLVGFGAADEPLGFGPGFGFGAWFEFDRGAQLAHGGAGGQLGVVLIGALGSVFGDHPDLIQRQPPLTHPLRAAGELFEPTRHRHHRLGVAWGDTGLPGHQRRDRPGPGRATQLVTIQLSNNLHEAPIDRIALTHQLSHLVEQHLQPPHRGNPSGERSCGRRHDTIIAEGYDKFGSPTWWP